MSTWFVFYGPRQWLKQYIICFIYILFIYEYGRTHKKHKHTPICIIFVVTRFNLVLGTLRGSIFVPFEFIFCSIAPFNLWMQCIQAMYSARPNDTKLASAKSDFLLFGSRMSMCAVLGKWTNANADYYYNLRDFCFSICFFFVPNNCTIGHCPMHSAPPINCLLSLFALYFPFSISMEASATISSSSLAGRNTTSLCAAIWTISFHLCAWISRKMLVYFVRAATVQVMNCIVRLTYWSPRGIR